jgi:hypothetical protein
MTRFTKEELRVGDTAYKSIFDALSEEQFNSLDEEELIEIQHEDNSRYTLEMFEQIENTRHPVTEGITTRLEMESLHEPDTAKEYHLISRLIKYSDGFKGIEERLKERFSNWDYDEAIKGVLY